MADLTVADLEPRITIHPCKYVPGTGKFDGRPQVGDDRFELKEPITFQPGNDGELENLQNVPYDVEIEFGPDVHIKLPNLFGILNGLPLDQEVHIPDTGYIGRDFYIVGRRFICTAIMVRDARFVHEQLQYILEVFSSKFLLLCPQQDTRSTIVRSDVEKLFNILDSGVLNTRKLVKLEHWMRNLAGRLQQFLCSRKQW